MEKWETTHHLLLWQLVSQMASWLYLYSARLLTRLVAAAAVARSGFPLILLAATRGNAEPGVEGTVVPRLAGVDGCRPLTVECRLPTVVAFTGELPEMSRLRINVPFLRLVPGGSGSGRAVGLDRVVARLFERLAIP